MVEPNQYFFLFFSSIGWTLWGFEFFFFLCQGGFVFRALFLFVLFIVFLWCNRFRVCLSLRYCSSTIGHFRFRRIHFRKSISLTPPYKFSDDNTTHLNAFSKILYIELHQGYLSFPSYFFSPFLLCLTL